MKPHLELLAPAKINLFLELDSKRPDGFHELETVMVCVNLCDRLNFVVRDDHEIHLSVGEGSLGVLPPVNDNLVTKALRLLQQRYSVSQDERLFDQANTLSGGIRRSVQRRSYGVGGGEQALGDLPATG